MPISSIVAVAVAVAQKKKDSLLKDKKKKRKTIKGVTQEKPNKKSIQNVNYEPYINNPLGNDIK